VDVRVKGVIGQRSQHLLQIFPTSLLAEDGDVPRLFGSLIALREFWSLARLFYPRVDLPTHAARESRRMIRH
jgi:hypothetical protein